MLMNTTFLEDSFSIKWQTRVVLPFLRKLISARACAMLWLLPNYLYITQQSYMEIPKPLITLHASSKLVKALASIWLIGFIAVFGT